MVIKVDASDITESPPTRCLHDRLSATVTTIYNTLPLNLGRLKSFVADIYAKHATSPRFQCQTPDVH